MNVTTTAIPGVLILEPRIFEDSRGHFFESFNHTAFEKALGEPVSFVPRAYSDTIPALFKSATVITSPLSLAVNEEH